MLAASTSTSPRQPCPGSKARNLTSSAFRKAIAKLVTNASFAKALAGNVDDETRQLVLDLYAALTKSQQDVYECNQALKYTRQLLNTATR